MNELLLRAAEYVHASAETVSIQNRWIELHNTLTSGSFALVAIGGPILFGALIFHIIGDR